MLYSRFRSRLSSIPIRSIPSSIEGFTLGPSPMIASRCFQLPLTILRTKRRGFADAARAKKRIEKAFFTVDW